MPRNPDNTIFSLSNRVWRRFSDRPNPRALLFYLVGWHGRSYNFLLYWSDEGRVNGGFDGTSSGIIVRTYLGLKDRPLTLVDGRSNRYSQHSRIDMPSLAFHVITSYHQTLYPPIETDCLTYHLVGMPQTALDLMEGLTIEGGRSHWTGRHTIGTQAGITLALGFLVFSVA